MRNLFLTLLVIILGTATFAAQDWQDDATGEAQFSCGTVRLLVAEQGDEIYIRLSGQALTVEEFHKWKAPLCWLTTPADDVVSETAESQETFRISVNDVVNLRECAGTNCARIGLARPGNEYDVIGEDGDWYEISVEGGSAFIAGWLTTPLVDSPTGLLADFQFRSEEALAPLYGHTERTGTWWLNLERADGANTDIQIESIEWFDDHTAGDFRYPVIFGWGGNDWAMLPGLLPDSSFYIYLPDGGEIHEFAISDAPYVTSFELGWNNASRPVGIGSGTALRLIVADSGQADQIKNWAAAVTNSERVAPPAQPSPPQLVAGDGQVTVVVRAAPPASGGAPITTFELRYRQAGTDSFTQLGNVNEGDFVIDGLTNGNTYEIAIAPVNRGGKGAYSDWATASLPASSG